MALSPRQHRLAGRVGIVLLLVVIAFTIYFIAAVVWTTLTD